MKNLGMLLVVVFSTCITQAQNKHIESLKLILESTKTNFESQLGELVGTQEGATIYKTKINDDFEKSFIIDFPADGGSPASRNYIIKIEREIDANQALQSVKNARFSIAKFTAREKLAELAKLVKEGTFTTKDNIDNGVVTFTDWFDKKNQLTVRYATSENLLQFIFYTIGK